MKKKHKEPLLSEDDVTRAYKDALRAVGGVKGTIPDETRQLMADAVHEFYHRLEERIESRRANDSQRAS
jgi:hypothetical protein